MKKKILVFGVLYILIFVCTLMVSFQTEKLNSKEDYKYYQNNLAYNFE